MSEPIALSRDRLSGTDVAPAENLDLAVSPEVSRRSVCRLSGGISWR
jgi:hypothetical protein